MTEETATASKSPRLCWIYPDRGTQRQRIAEANAIWTTYEKIAGDIGVEMSLHKPEEIAVESVGAEPRVFLNGERITPEDTMLVTSLWSLPHQTQDVCNLLFLYTILEQAGFYLPIPPRLSYITTDKMATMLYLRDCPVPTVPTARISSGRDAPTGHYDPVVSQLDYPLLVKPAYWGMGMGVCVAHNQQDLRGIVGLAGGADTVLVAQPYLGEVNDFRVYVVEGEVRTVLRRIPAQAALTANLVNGGTAEYVSLPQELEEAVSYVISQLPIPYLAIDFLYDGEQFWLSEVEPDGALGYANSDEVARIQRPTIEARFQAYLRAHTRWISAGKHRERKTAEGIL